MNDMSYVSGTERVKSWVDGNVFGLISPVMSDGTVAMGVGAEA